MKKVELIFDLDREGYELKMYSVLDRARLCPYQVFLLKDPPFIIDKSLFIGQFWAAMQEGILEWVSRLSLRTALLDRHIDHIDYRGLDGKPFDLESVKSTETPLYGALSIDLDKSGRQCLSTQIEATILGISSKHSLSKKVNQ